MQVIQSKFSAKEIVHLLCQISSLIAKGQAKLGRSSRVRQLALHDQDLILPS